MKKEIRKESKEAKDIIKAIEAYHKKYDGEVGFIGTFWAFDDEGEMMDDMIIGYGHKDCLIIAMDEINTHLKKDKDDFINW